MNDRRLVAMGCMRLSTEPDRDEVKGVAVIHAALDAGITLLDTADAYCRDDLDRGHNERLIARALASWQGDRSAVMVATKGGITRPDGRWESDGRARHLRAACEASCRALGVNRIDRYQLHAPDPRTPLATSVRALAALKRDGLIASIGLCNVTVGQIVDARRIADIESVQVELSVWQDAHFLSGVAEYCARHRLTLLAYRPLGGRRSRARTAADPALAEVAARHAATPAEIALAWLADLSDVIVPLPGATREETARSAARAIGLALTDEDRRLLDARFPAGASLRRGHDRVAVSHVRQDAEVVLVMGLPAAGKTTFSERLVARGYRRLNRDDRGGRVRGLLPALDAALAAGERQIVLDNTYVSRKSRAEVVRAAADRGVAVRCVWLSTPVEDAQVNAAWRLVSRYGMLPDEESIAALGKKDPSAFLPGVQFRYQRELEPPDPSEGFSSIEVVPFEGRRWPGHEARAVLIWCDGLLVRSRAGHRTPSDPDDVAVDERLVVALRRWTEEGRPVFGLSWQPEIAEGSRTADQMRAVVARVNDLTGLSMDVSCCPHAAGPPRCWCRKPLPGLGVMLIHRHRLDPAASVYIGTGAQDRAFARRLGFEYCEATDLRG
jgi:aryl-alcohol dehydrogenase-like predicted oxidoreductase/histidinol phosphatase-like enzyme/predicted kinase